MAASNAIDFEVLINDLQQSMALIDASYGREDLSSDDIVTLSDFRIQFDALLQLVTSAKASDSHEPQLIDAFSLIPKLTELIKSRLS